MVSRSIWASFLTQLSANLSKPRTRHPSCHVRRKPTVCASTRFQRHPPTDMPLALMGREETEGGMGAEDVLSVHSVRKPPRSTLWGAVTACPTVGGRPHTGLLVRASLLASVSRIGVPRHEEPIS